MNNQCENHIETILLSKYCLICLFLLFFVSFVFSPVIESYAGLGFFFLPTVKDLPSPDVEVSAGVSVGISVGLGVSSATGISTVTVSSASGLLRFV